MTMFGEGVRAACANVTLVVRRIAHLPPLPPCFFFDPFAILPLYEYS